MIEAASAATAGALYHVLTARTPVPGRPKPRCGATEITVAYCRADVVPLEQRCAADGCYQAWPSTYEDVAFSRVARSAWGRRAAGILERLR